MRVRTYSKTMSAVRVPILLMERCSKTSSGMLRAWTYLLDENHLLAQASPGGSIAALVLVIEVTHSVKAKIGSTPIVFLRRSM